MIKWKTYAPLGVASVTGLLAARVATSLVSAPAEQVAVAQNLTPILVAARDMDAGATLTEADLSTMKVDADTLPAGAVTQAASLVGKVIKTSVSRGQPILPNTVADEGAGYGVGATLPKGMRAVTVDINDTTGVAGFVLPKSHVDVITTINIDSKQVARTLLEDVYVLAVGTRTNPTAADGGNGNPQQAARTVTLLVKPKEAERLELAATASRVRLVLRNGKDTTTADSNGVTLADLRGDRVPTAGDPFADPTAIVPTAAHAEPTPEPTTKPTKSEWTVQIIKGGQVSTQTFDVPTKKDEPKTDESPAATPQGFVGTDDVSDHH